MCSNCGKRIPFSASFCNECKTYQGVRQHFTVMATILSLVLASFAICNGVYVAATYLSDRDSHTRFKVTSADDDHVILKVWNTGRRPSTLVAYRVICDDWPAKEVTLDLSDKDKLEAMNVIAPGKPVKIRLAPARQIPPPLESKQFAPKDYLDLSEHSSRSLTLEIDVEESDDPGGDEWDVLPLLLQSRGYRWSVLGPRQYHIRSDRFPAARILEFVRQRRPGNAQ